MKKLEKRAVLVSISIIGATVLLCGAIFAVTYTSLRLSSLRAAIDTQEQVIEKLEERTIK